MVSLNSNLLVQEITRHYLQGATIKELRVLPDPEDGQLVAIVVPDLDHFRKTGETDILGEVGWEIEYYSQQLSPTKRIRHFVLTSQGLPQDRLEKIKTDEIAARYQELARKRRQNRRSALAEEGLTATGKRVVNILHRKTGAEPIALDDHLELDLGLDSLALVELLSALEETFGVQIQDGEFLGIFTVGELIRFIEGKQPHEFKELEGRELTWGKILKAPPPPALREQLEAGTSVKCRLFHLGFSQFLKFLCKLWFALEVYGRERLGTGSYILCPNHGSFLDGFLLFAALPQSLRSRLHFLGYNNYFEGPVVKSIANCMHIVPVNSARHLIPAMQASGHILNRGDILGIFPEGARSLTGELRPFKKGVATLAKEVGIPLVPVYIHGSFQAWGPNARFPRPHPIQIIFGQECSADFLAAKGWESKPAAPPYEAMILGLRQEVLRLRDEIKSITSREKLKPAPG